MQACSHYNSRRRHTTSGRLYEHRTAGGDDRSLQQARFATIIARSQHPPSLHAALPCTLITPLDALTHPFTSRSSRYRWPPRVSSDTDAPSKRSGCGRASCPCLRSVGSGPVRPRPSWPTYVSTAISYSLHAHRSPRVRRDAERFPAALNNEASSSPSATCQSINMEAFRQAESKFNDADTCPADRDVTVWVS